MIDRIARTKLAHAIRNDFASQVNSQFETAGAIQNATDAYFFESDDTAVTFVSGEIFRLRDDSTSNGFPRSNSQWGYFQRLLLLLESASTVTRSSSRQWSITQLMAAALLCLFLLSVFGLGFAAVPVYPLFGLTSIALSRFRKTNRPSGPYSAIVSPFSSIHDLGIAYDAAPHFTKTKFPMSEKFNHEERRSHPKHGLWMLFAPIVLLRQCGPITTTNTKVDPGCPSTCVSI